MRRLAIGLVLAVAAPASAAEVWSCVQQQPDDPTRTIFQIEMRIDGDSLELKYPPPYMPSTYRIIENNDIGLVATQGHAFVDPHQTVVNAGVLLLKKGGGDGDLLLAAIDLDEHFSNRVVGRCRKL